MLGKAEASRPDLKSNQMPPILRSVHVFIDSQNYAAHIMCIILRQKGLIWSSGILLSSILLLNGTAAIFTSGISLEAARSQTIIQGSVIGWTCCQVTQCNTFGFTCLCITVG